MPDHERMTDELLALIDPGLHDGVARCAAAAGYRLRTAGVDDCRGEWLRAAAVVLDPTAVRALAGRHTPRRERVVIVADDEPGPEVWREALVLGAADVFALPLDEADLVACLTAMRSPRARPGAAIAVIGGHGGAGASVLAAAVALTAVDHHRVLLLDVDELGGGIDLTLGVEAEPGLRWQDLAIRGGTVRGQALHDALPHAVQRLSVLAPRRPAGPAALGGAGAVIEADAVRATMDAGRADGDVVVVDLPRADNPVMRTVVDSVDLVLVITTATVAGVASSRAVAARIGLSGPAVELAVRGPAPGGLRAPEVAAAVDLPLLVAYRSDPGLAGRLESGRLRLGGRQPLGRAARTVCRRLLDVDRPAA